MTEETDDFIPCTKCGGNWLNNPSPMVHNHIWQAIGRQPSDLLCDDCLADALFYDCPWNHMVAAKYVMEGNNGKQSKGA